MKAEGYFVGRDGSFAEDGPGVVSGREVNDGGCDGAGGGTAIDDEGDLVAKLVADALGGGALGKAAEVGGGGGNGQTEAGDDSARDGGLGDAQGDVASVGGDTEGKLGAGADDDGQGSGPKAFGEAVEGGVAGTGEGICLCHVGDKQRKRFMARARLDVVDAIDGVEIDWVDGETVEGVGRQGDAVAGIERLSDEFYERGLGLVGVDAKDLGRQR